MQISEINYIKIPNKGMQSTQTYPKKFICDSFAINVSQLDESSEVTDVNEVLAWISTDDFFIMLV